MTWLLRSIAHSLSASEARSAWVAGIMRLAHPSQVVVGFIAEELSNNSALKSNLVF
jgi:hypothetical protein